MSINRPVPNPEARARARLALQPALLTCLALATACTPSADQAAEGTAAADQTSSQPAEPDHFVPSTPDNLSWGWFPIDKEPVLRMQSGETVRVNTLTHVGAGQSEDPATYLTGLGIPREEILDDVLDFWATREGRPREGRSGHVITGPIHVEGAEPGDVLEIEILSIETRVPWGVNSTSARGGVFSTSYPGYAEGDPALDIPPGTRHVIRTGEVDGTEVAFFSDDIQVPLAPFMGILAVAPDPVVGQPGVTVPGVQGIAPARRLRRQPRRQGPDRRHHAVPPRVPPRRSLLCRRSAWGSGRR